MNLCKILLLLLLVVCTPSFAVPGYGYSTLLVIVEESDNKFSPNKNSTPISDGIVDVLWMQNCIFFDIQATQAMTSIDGKLQLKPFLSDAKYSGADGVLLIKASYKSSNTKSKRLRIQMDNISYSLYSLSGNRLLKNGNFDTLRNDVINHKNKYEHLKKIGVEIATEIYK